MEFDINTEKVFCIGTAGEKKAVLPLECSIILPDYFPDVMKILRYTAKTVKSPVVSEPDGETVSGNVNVEVSYVSEEGELCSVSQLRPFSHCFEKGGDISAAEADVNVGEIGCRAVNKRRIDLHGSIEITLRTLCGEEKRFLESVEGAGAVCRYENTETVEPLGELYKSFTFEDKAEIGYGKPPFGKVLRASSFGEVTECHVIQDKIVTKGEIHLRVLWIPEREEGEATELICSDFVFPISRMVEANGILLTDTCDARYETEFPEFYPADDGKSIGIRMKIGIFARAYRKVNAKYIRDMFSTEYETKTEKAKLSIINRAIPISATETLFEKIELPESAESVTDIWTEIRESKFTPEGNIALFAKICMFAKDAEGMPAYFEKTVEKEISSPAKGSNIAFYNLCAGVRSEEYSAGNDGKAEISANVLIDGTAYAFVSTDAIVSCSQNGERKNEQDFAPLILYYAEKGEGIWDIAKKYKASLSEIKAENGIDGDVIEEKTMLVVPG